MICFVSLNACFYNGIQFDKDFYERISGIKFPSKYTVLETFDNREFLTGTVFKIGSIDLAKLVVDYHFDTLHQGKNINLISQGYLKENKFDVQDKPGVFYIEKSRDKNNWVYIADLNSGRLWAEISYPDWGGQ